jgi:geranylgeranyl diphosphate synthase type 3
MFENGSLNYTREKCTEMKREIGEQVLELGGNEQLLKVIEMFDVQVEKIAEVHGGGLGEECGGGIPKKSEDRLKNLDYR